MLKHRLLFGFLMVVLFTGLIVVDGWIDGTITLSPQDDKPVKATLFTILLAALVILGERELSYLAALKNLKILSPVSTVITVIVVTSLYWVQFLTIPLVLYFFAASVLVFLALTWYHHLRFGPSGLLANSGVSFFSIVYLGFIPAFVLAIRVHQGLWYLFMFVLVVKAADIGAYALGSLLGKHKFSPIISPKKTWEGMGGAVIGAVIVSIAFSVIFDIITIGSAVVFGVCFAFLGQLGDLAESMIKRDAGLKDSACIVPGFGGILDIIDSPLIAAPFAYIFFRYVCF